MESQTTQKAKGRIRPKRVLEPDEISEMIRRMLRAYGVRLREAMDPDDLKGLLALRGDMERELRLTIHALYRNGSTISDIARSMGYTRQAIQQVIRKDYDHPERT